MNCVVPVTVSLPVTVVLPTIPVAPVIVVAPVMPTVLPDIVNVLEPLPIVVLPPATVFNVSPLPRISVEFEVFPICVVPAPATVARLI